MIFLRPIFLILLPVIFILYFIKKNSKTNNKWQKFISPKFQPFLLISNKKGKEEKSSFYKIAVLWCLLVIALAGPSFEKIPTDTGTSLDGTILLVDLNSLNPKTLMQLKIKLSETLKNLTSNRVGLVLYDHKGYVALPMTEDIQIIQEMIPALSPSVLPQIGNYPEQGFKTAIEQLKNNNLSTGRILFFTGGVNSVDEIIPLIENNDYEIATLALGEENTKTPVLSSNGQFQRDKSGNLILITPEKKMLSKLGPVAFATPDNKDIDYLLKASESIASENIFNEKDNPLLKLDSYKDVGVYLLVLLMPFIALFFRKGVFFVLIFFTLSQQAHASIWIREDQKLYQTNQKAIEDYRAKDYLSALAGFTQDKSSTGLYNQANAKAHMGYIPEAIDLYNQVLAQNPNHKEAQFNKDYLERLMKKNQEKEKQNSNQNQDNKSENQQQNNPENQEESKKENKDNENNPQPEQNNEMPEDENEQNLEQPSSNNSQENEKEETENQNPEDEQNNSLQEEKNQESNQTPQENKTKSLTDEKSDAENQKQTLKEEKENESLDQSSQEIFNRLKKDPSRVLRHRLKEQNRRNK